MARVSRIYVTVSLQIYNREIIVGILLRQSENTEISEQLRTPFWITLMTQGGGVGSLVPSTPVQ